MDTPLKYHSQQILELGAITSSVIHATVIGNDLVNTDNLYTDNQLVLYVNVAGLGNLTSVNLIQEFSSDLTIWAQETFASITGAVETDSLGYHSLGGTGVYRLATPLKDRYVRVSVQGIGGSGSGSSVGILAIYGTA